MMDYDLVYSLKNITKVRVQKEILYGVAEKNGNIEYALDQLSSAQIEISADSTDITDKKGN